MGAGTSLVLFFEDHLLTAITVAEVDRYRTAKIREGDPAPNSVNKTLVRLAQVLELAVEYGTSSATLAKSKRRRPKLTAPKRSWVEP